MSLGRLEEVEARAELGRAALDPVPRALVFLAVGAVAVAVAVAVPDPLAEAGLDLDILSPTSRMDVNEEFSGSPKTVVGGHALG